MKSTTAESSVLLKRTSIACLTVVLISSTLSACTPEDEVSAKLQDGLLVFAVCEGYHFDRVTVTVARTNVAETYWEATGEGFVDDGQIVTYGEALDGLDVRTPPRRLKTESGWIAISLSVDDSAGSPIRKRFASFEASRL